MMSIGSRKRQNKTKRTGSHLFSYFLKCSYGFSSVVSIVVTASARGCTIRNVLTACKCAKNASIYYLYNYQLSYIRQKSMMRDDSVIYCRFPEYRIKLEGVSKITAQKFIISSLFHFYADEVSFRYCNSYRLVARLKAANSADIPI